MNRQCNVCLRELSDPVFSSEHNQAITSLSEQIDGSVHVFYCSNCNHLNTNELPELQLFYAEKYKLNITSEDSDQLYGVINGMSVYRSDKQAALVIEKLNISKGANVLDFGCGRAATMEKIVKYRNDITPYLFDVSDMYVGFWNTFAKPEHYACFDLPKNWINKFDVITSFYALEHIATLQQTIKRIHEMLIVGGVFYFMVPNVFDNAADFIVADHVNHFSSQSLYYLLAQYGFEEIKIDDSSFTAAYIVTARKRRNNCSQPAQVQRNTKVNEQFKAVSQMAYYWKNINKKVLDFERSITTENSVVYGAGFYGCYLLSVLLDTTKICYIVDNNKHLQGTFINGIKVIAPNEVPDDIDIIYVGLNPKTAPKIIAASSLLNNSKYKLFTM